MEEEFALKDGIGEGGGLAGICVSDRVESAKEIDGVRIDEGMEDVSLPTERHKGGSAAFEQGIEGKGVVEDGFLDTCEEEMASNDDVSDGSPALQNILIPDGGANHDHPNKGVLDWKRAVLGECIKEKGMDIAVGSLMAHDERTDLVGNEGGKVTPLPSGIKVNEHVWVNNHCRKIVFDAKKEVFLEDDGLTVNMDEVAASDCERRLNRALVGKILGRPVPFGFLNRDLRRKWGKFGKIQMSLIRRNCFVCFFESEEIRDTILKGGSWFVGDQLVGLDRWTGGWGWCLNGV